MEKSVTIATHHGTAVRFRHNRREPAVVSREDHIDISRPHEVWFEKSLQDVYEEQFGQAIREYDAKQARPSRRIGGVQAYMERISRDRAKTIEYNESVRAENEANASVPGYVPRRAKGAPALVYEVIVGVYQKDGPEMSSDEKKAILREYADDWAKRNPSMALVGVYYHDDEEGKDPHLHIDYVPVGTGYKHGMAVQNSLERACGSMGYTSSSITDTAQMRWQAADNEYLQRLCESHGLSVERPQAGKRSKHKSTAQYKLEKRLEEMAARNAELERRNAELESQVTGLFPGVRKAKRLKQDARQAADAAERRRSDEEGRLSAIRAETLADEQRALQARQEAERYASEIISRAEEEARKTALRASEMAQRQMKEMRETMQKCDEALRKAQEAYDRSQERLSPDAKGLYNWLKNRGATVDGKPAYQVFADEAAERKKHERKIGEVYSQSAERRAELDRLGRNIRPRDRDDEYSL